MLVLAWAFFFVVTPVSAFFIGVGFRLLHVRWPLSYGNSSLLGRVGVLMDVESNGTQGIQGFIQVWASMKIKTLRPVCVICIIIHCIETTSTPHFIG
jgi:hypothetical protein